MGYNETSPNPITICTWYLRYSGQRGLGDCRGSRDLGAEFRVGPHGFSRRDNLIHNPGTELTVTKYCTSAETDLKIFESLSRIGVDTGRLGEQYATPVVSAKSGLWWPFARIPILTNVHNCNMV